MHAVQLAQLAQPVRVDLRVPPVLEVFKGPPELVVFKVSVV